MGEKRDELEMLVCKESLHELLYGNKQLRE